MDSYGEALKLKGLEAFIITSGENYKKEASEKG